MLGEKVYTVGVEEGWSFDYNAHCVGLTNTEHCQLGTFERSPKQFN